MIFIILAFIGFLLFVAGQRVLSLIILFFFVTNGFQFIPVEIFETDLGIKQALDFAIIEAFLIFIYSFFKDKSIISPKDNRVNYFLLLFLIVFGVIILFNILILRISVGQVIKTIRPYMLLTAFYSFRNITEKEYSFVKNILLFITFIQCFLFIAQIFLNEQILNGYFGGGKITIGNLEFTRCYNIPLLLPYFVFQVFFSDRYSGNLKIVLEVLFFVTILLPMHRAWILSLMVVMAYGIFIKADTQKKLIKYALLLSLFLLPIGGFLIDRFQSSNIKEDINSALSGSFENFDFELDNENTLFYRFAHLYERIFYISEDWKTLLLGGGLMTEDSDQAANLNFLIVFHIPDEDVDMMISTPDIAWSMMFFRLGFVGTIAYMLFYLALMVYFYKNRKKHYCAAGTFLFLLFTIFTSFTSVELITIWPLLLPALDFTQCIMKDEDDQLTQPETIL